MYIWSTSMWRWLSCGVAKSNGARCGRARSESVRNICSPLDCFPPRLADSSSARRFECCCGPAPFHEAGCRLVHRYRLYMDPFPNPALRGGGGGVITRLLSCVSRAMAIARLTHLRFSVPASGAPPGHVPADCFPGGAPRKIRPGSLWVSFADDVTMLGEGSPSVCSPVLEELTPLVSASLWMTSLFRRGRRMALPRSSWTLSHLLRVSRRSLGRSSLDMSPSHSPVLRSAMVVHRTFLQAIRMWSPVLADCPGSGFGVCRFAGRCTPGVSSGGCWYGYGDGCQSTSISFADHREPLSTG